MAVVALTDVNDERSWTGSLLEEGQDIVGLSGGS